MINTEIEKILRAIAPEAEDCYPFRLTIKELKNNPRFKYEIDISSYDGDGDELTASVNHDYEFDDIPFGIGYKPLKVTVSQDDVIAYYRMMREKGEL